MNTGLKKVIIALACVAVLAAAIFAISTYHGEHVYDHSCDVDCNVCGEIRADIVHQLETVEGYDATCTKEGLRAYEVCKNCGYSTCSAEHVIAKLSHKEAAPVKENVVKETCAVDGSYESVVYCADCDKELSRESIAVKAHGNHDFSVLVPAKAATCLKGWYEHHACSVCGKEADDYVEIAPVYGHIESKYATEIPGTRKDATCTVDGEYKLGKYCTNDYCHEPIGSYEIIVLEATGHAYKDNVTKDEYDKTVPAKAATCTEPGYEAYTCCSKCGHYDENDVVEIPALGHAKEKHPEVAPTCTEDGNWEYWTCNTCNGVFADEECTEVTTIENRYRKATGHKPPESDDNRYPEKYYVVENLVEPTCTETGSYDRVVYCGTCGVEMSRENWIVPEVAHNMVIEVPAKAPTCTEPGYEAYICCSKCGYYDENDVVEIPATGHSETTYEKSENITPATCVTDGGYDLVDCCSVCDDEVSREYITLPATGHSETTYEKSENITSATCVTDGGYDLVVFCSVCDEELSHEYITDPATGHDYDANGYCQNSGCSERISVGLSFKLNSDGGYTFTGVGSCTDTEIVIPSEVNGVPVTAIAAEALYNNSSVKSVVIPDSVKTVGEEAFFYCDSLESVVIGNGVEEIGAFAFFYCESLTSVTVGSSVKSIGNGAFNYCPISVVYYHGTAAQWNGISIAGNNSDLTGANREYI